MSIQNFWRNLNYDNRRLILRDSPQVNNVWYLFPQGGGPSGAHTFETFAELSPNLKDRDLILFGGVLREQAIAPVAYDVHLLGVANKPRQATSGGVPTGGGASWLAPTTPVAATPLLQVIAQGWIIENIQFAPVAASDCIRFRRMETAAIPDASHGIVRGCYFSTGGAAGHGINVGECAHIQIEDCRFQSLTGAGGTAIRRTADGGIAVTDRTIVQDCDFFGNANDIILLLGTNCIVRRNVFHDAVDGARKFIQITGVNGHFYDNHFAGAVGAGITVANGFEGVASSVWRNWVTDAVDPVIADPV